VNLLSFYWEVVVATRISLVDAGRGVCFIEVKRVRLKGMKSKTIKPVLLYCVRLEKRLIGELRKSLAD